jgi:hypothetical protein
MVLPNFRLSSTLHKLYSNVPLLRIEMTSYTAATCLQKPDCVPSAKLGFDPEVKGAFLGWSAIILKDEIDYTIFDDIVAAEADLLHSIGPKLLPALIHQYAYQIRASGKLLSNARTREFGCCPISS